MTELQKVNHLLDTENSTDDSMNIDTLKMARFANFNPEEVSETIFLEESDDVIIYGRNTDKVEPKKNQGSIEFKLYSTPDADLYSYLDIEITREEDGMLKFADKIYFSDKENILYLDNHVVGVPKGSEVYFYPLFVMIQLAGKRLILYWSEQKFSIESKEYLLSNTAESNVFIDDLGNIAISYLDVIATFRFQAQTMDVNGYRLHLDGEKQTVKLNKKWIELSSDIQFNGADGVVRYQYSYVKVPKKAELFFNNEELSIVIDNKYNVKFLVQVDRLVFREEKYWLVFDVNSRIVIDKKGGLVFLHQDNLVFLDKEKAIIKASDMTINIADGAIVRVTKDSIYMNEVVKVNPFEKIVRVAKSKFFFSGAVNISLNKAEALFNVNNKLIRVMPYKKQVFINVGGKLIVITVSIGIAVDGNGNIAFDYQNSLTTLDTDYFVMNVGGSIFSFGSIDDCCCEFLGNQIAVGSQKQNVLELLKTMLATDLSAVLTKYDLQSLIESLLSTDMGSFLNSDSLLGSGVDINILMDLVKGSILSKITGSGESCFAIMNKNNMEQIVMGNKTFDIRQGNNFYVPINMEFLQGVLKFKDKKVYFIS
ncbi:MAG: hypothetical protein PHF25_04150 [Candidatus Margulisbacteria bacterium]|nr:hypothetical protein [Candidatus Margulisiibacteriota bacterium]